MASLNKIVKGIILKNMSYKKGESILVVTDDAKKELADEFLKAAHSITFDSRFVSMAPRKENGEEPAREIAEAMLNADIILIVTSKSLTHTNARKRACAKGARVASMPGITKEMIERAIDIDYNKMGESMMKLTIALKKTKKVRVITEKGTDIIFEVPQMIKDDTGLYIDKGDFGNLPAGEVFLAPINASGRLIIDGSMLEKKLADPIEVVIKNNYAISFGKNKMSAELKNKLEKVGKDGFNLAEFGIGMNPKAIITGNILEDEKAQGTVHFAFGNNASFGGNVNVPIHLDGVILKPTVYFDEKVIIEEGKN